MRLARALAAGAVATALLGGLTACGGGGSEDPPDDASGPVSGLALNPDAADPSLDPDAGASQAAGPLSASEVAANLRVVSELARSATAALGPNDLELLPEHAPQLQAQIAPEWANVGPTVKERDEATHRTLEEAFPVFGAAVGAKDQAAARAAADRIAAAVDAYVAKFPPDNPPADMPDEDEDGSPDEPGDGSMPGFTPAPDAGPQPAEDLPAETPSP